MTRETIGLTAYRLIFDDGSIAEIASVALIDVLTRCDGYKPSKIYVLDQSCKTVDQQSIDLLWDKIQARTPALY